MARLSEPNGPKATGQRSTQQTTALLTAASHGGAWAAGARDRMERSSMKNQMGGSSVRVPQNSRESFQPFFPGSESFHETIQKPKGNSWFLKRTLVENNGESNPRKMPGIPPPSLANPQKGVPTPKKIHARMLLCK